MISIGREERTQLRSDGKIVSRGAFNRIRRQALNNIISSIYTVLLLGYLGVFETPQLEPFIEGANKLKSYMEAVKKSAKYDEAIEVLTRSLIDELEGLSRGEDYYKA